MTERDAPDSFTEHLTGAMRSRTGRSLLQRALPWIGGLLFGVCTGVMGWAGGKLDTKAELQASIELRKEDAAKEKRAVERHQQLLAKFDTLETSLFSVEQLKPGRITKLERDQYWAWRAITEVKAAAYGAESYATQAKKERVASKFIHSFDLQTQKETAAVAYDILFRAAHIE